MTGKEEIQKHYLVASDFDQTLSFKDSGIMLSELLGIDGFEEKVAGLSRINLVQQGGELAYLLLHDPEFRRVRKEHLIRNRQEGFASSTILACFPISPEGIEGYRFSFYVVSAAPEEVIQSALKEIIPPDHIYGTRFRYDPHRGRSNRSSEFPPATEKSRCSMTCRRHCRSAPIAYLIWATAARTCT